MELADDLTSQHGGWLTLCEEGEGWALGALSSSDLRVALWRNQKSILSVTAEGSVLCPKCANRRAVGRLTSSPGSEIATWHSIQVRGLCYVQSAVQSI